MWTSAVRVWCVQCITSNTCENISKDFSQIKVIFITWNLFTHSHPHTHTHKICISHHPPKCLMWSLRVWQSADTIKTPIYKTPSPLEKCHRWLHIYILIGRRGCWSVYVWPFAFAEPDKCLLKVYSTHTERWMRRQRGRERRTADGCGSATYLKHNSGMNKCTFGSWCNDASLNVCITPIFYLFPLILPHLLLSFLSPSHILSVYLPFALAKL